MSTPDKIDHARGWMFVEELMAEDEAKRIESLSDDELRAEMRRQGRDPERLPSAEELLAKATARAAQQRRDLTPQRATAPVAPKPAVKPEPAGTAPDRADGNSSGSGAANGDSERQWNSRRGSSR